MDTEEDLKLKTALIKGTPETDEGPYYHDSWWESYKGSVKGKLGGAIIGAGLGAVVGVAAVAIVALLGTAMTLTAGALAVAAFAAGGMLYGEQEFSEVGKITGAVAAAHETSEQRMKNFENGKFSEIKNEIGELKAMIAGKKAAAGSVNESVKVSAAPADYRTTHCDEHCDDTSNKLVYWKVAAVGLAVGAAAGVILAAGALAVPALGIAGALGTAGAYTASVVTMGLFGASFGVNRDIFRHVFDKTDLWFKGVLERKNGEHAPDVKLHVEKPRDAREVTTLVSENFISYPTSDTYHRDRVMAAAEKALLSFDHTRATPQ